MGEVSKETLLWKELGPQSFCVRDQKEFIGKKRSKRDLRCPNPSQLIKRVGMCFQKLLYPHPQN